MRIGVLATNDNDTFVHHLCYWILEFGQEPVVIYERDLYQNKEIIIDIESDKIGVEIKTEDNRTINFDQIEMFFRRSWHSEIFSSENEEDFFEKKEIYALREYILFKIEKNYKLIGRCSLDSLRKMNHLFYAKAAGLLVPNSIITSKKKALDLEKSNYISKAIESTYLKKEKGRLLSNYTISINERDLPNDFFPTLFQEKIQKELELRVFVYFEEVYCTAFLVSKDNYEKEVDIRLLISEGKTEPYPFNLPQEVKQKITNLMGKLKLDMASMDFIINEQGEYVLLDLNPFGQISMVSQTCFYDIEKLIALNLINYAKEKNSTRSGIRESIGNQQDEKRLAVK
jgi:hypothetical protein